MWWRTPEPGDWVRTTAEVKISLGDYLAGGGISEGTRGVVLERRGGRALVEFGGVAAARATVPFRDLRLVRRGGGVDRYRTRERRLAVVRLALAGFLLFPVLYFAAAYLWQYRTFEGIVPAFTEAAVWSLGEWVATAVAHPVQTLVYSAFLWVLARLAFKH